MHWAALAPTGCDLVSRKDTHGQCKLQAELEHSKDVVVWQLQLSF